MSGISIFPQLTSAEVAQIEFDKMIEDNASLKLIAERLDILNQHMQILTDTKIQDVDK